MAEGWPAVEVRARSLRHEIAEAVRVAIRERRLEPGARILETDLARRFNVSRQPVREAIRTLEREGLLTSLPNRGTFVTRVSVEDSLAICDVRAELEGLAARLAAPSLTADDRARLRAIPDEMSQAADAKDLHRLVELDLEIHDLIVDRANHRLLHEVLQSIAVYSRGFIVHTKDYYGADLAGVAELHRRLVKELLSRDPARAEAAVHAHIREAAARLRRVCAARGGAAAGG